MGGVIQVQSAINKGSTFRLLLPCKLPEVTLAPRPEEAPVFVTPTLRGDSSWSRTTRSIGR